jgi:hypothetical protein
MYFKKNKTGQVDGALIDADTDLSKIYYMSITLDDSTNLEDRYTYDMSEAEKNIYSKLIQSRNYYNFILSRFSEDHTEAFSGSRYLSDAFAVFGSGAVPVKVVLSGYLNNDTKINHLIDFINLYNSFIRGYSQSRFKFDLNVWVEGTFFIFKPDMFDFVIDSSNSNPDNMVPFLLTGTGFKYKHFDQSTS